MKKKYLAYAILPVMGLALLSAGTASANSLFGGFGMMNSATPEQIVQNMQNQFNKEASLLGITVEDVKNAWAEGKTLQQIAQEHGITQDELKQKIADAQKQQLSDYLKNLVDNGVITQAQADKRLQFLQSQTQKMGKHGHGYGRWLRLN